MVKESSCAKWSLAKFGVPPNWDPDSRITYPWWRLSWLRRVVQLRTSAVFPGLERRSSRTSWNPSGRAPTSGPPHGSGRHRTGLCPSSDDPAAIIPDRGVGAEERPPAGRTDQQRLPVAKALYPRRHPTPHIGPTQLLHFVTPRQPDKRLRPRSDRPGGKGDLSPPTTPTPHTSNPTPLPHQSTQNYDRSVKYAG